MNKLVFILAVLILIVFVAGCSGQLAETGEKITESVSSWVNRVLTTVFTIITFILIIFCNGRVINWGNAYATGGTTVVGGITREAAGLIVTLNILGIFVVIHLILLIIQIAIWYSLIVLRITLPVLIPFMIFLFLSDRKSKRIKEIVSVQQHQQFYDPRMIPPRPGKPIVSIIIASLLWFFTFINIFLMTGDGSFEILYHAISLNMSYGEAFHDVGSYLRGVLYPLLLPGIPALIFTLKARMRYKKIRDYEMMYIPKAYQHPSGSMMFMVFAVLLWILYYITIQMVLQWFMYYVNVRLTMIGTWGDVQFMPQYLIPALIAAIAAMTFTLKAYENYNLAHQDDIDNSVISADPIDTPIDSIKCTTCGADTTSQHIMCPSCGNLLLKP